MAARRLLVPVLLVAALTATSCGGDGDIASPVTTREPNALLGIVRDQPLQVGDVVLPEVTTDPAGVPFAFKAQPGELLVGYFGYTSCPDVCPTTLANLASATAELGTQGERLSVAMVTVDPDRDTPSVLSGYLSSFTARPHALRTTEPDQLQGAEDAFGAQSSVEVNEEGVVEVQHTGTTYLIDETGTVLVEWPFGVSADDMRHDLEILLARIGRT